MAKFDLVHKTCNGGLAEQLMVKDILRSFPFPCVQESPEVAMENIDLIKRASHLRRLVICLSDKCTVVSCLSLLLVLKRLEVRPAISRHFTAQGRGSSEYIDI